jgi:hypothetical protein
MTDQALWFLIPLLGYGVLMLLLRAMFKRSLKGRQSNPMAEARVYLAYGQKKQAATILKEALAVDPANDELLAELKRIEGKTS